MSILVQVGATSGVMPICVVVVVKPIYVHLYKGLSVAALHRISK